MSDRLRESLSALMDDEADDLELGRVLRAMDEDDGIVRDTWARYQTVSAVMRGLPIAARADACAPSLMDGLTEGLETADQELQHPRAAEAFGAAGDDEHGAGLSRATADGGGRGRARPWLSFATAASVTLAAVLAFQYQGGDDETVPRVASAPARSAPVMTDPSGVMQASGGSSARVSQRPLPLRIPSPLMRTETPVQSTARRQVDAYMLYHAEMSALNSRSGMMPFARYAAFEGTPAHR